MDIEKKSLLQQAVLALVQNQASLRDSIEETRKSVEETREYLRELGEETDQRIGVLVAAVDKMVETRW